MTSLFAITHRTKDFGEKFVVREHRVVAGTVLVAQEPLAVEESLEAARAKLWCARPGAVNIGRSAGDDPVIVEVWV